MTSFPKMRQTRIMPNILLYSTYTMVYNPLQSERTGTGHHLLFVGKLLARSATNIRLH